MGPNGFRLVTTLDYRRLAETRQPPVGLAGKMTRRGEVRGARVAEAVGIPFSASNVGICRQKRG